jgi:hypothetical protein
VTTHYLCKVVFNTLSGLPRDKLTNDLSVRGPDAPASGDFDNLLNDIRSFMNGTATGQTHPLTYYLSSIVDTTPSATVGTIEVYKRPATAGPLGSPVYSGPFGRTTIGGTSLPEECNCAISFHADLTGIPEHSGATRPKAQRRGRIFWGPLTDAATGVDSASQEHFINTGFMTDANAAMGHLVNALQGHTPAWFLEVWSKVEYAGHDVIAGWVDNAIDTVRKRGPGPTTRATWGP